LKTVHGLAQGSRFGGLIQSASYAGDFSRTLNHDVSNGLLFWSCEKLAGATGLEPATSGVTATRCALTKNSAVIAGTVSVEVSAEVALCPTLRHTVSALPSDLPSKSTT